MTREMTSDEKKKYKGRFPNLNVNRAVVTGEKTRQYNCISWTVGITTKWIWPGIAISDFDTFYKAQGYV